MLNIDWLDCDPRYQELERGRCGDLAAREKRSESRNHHLDATIQSEWSSADARRTRVVARPGQDGSGIVRSEPFVE